MFSCDGDNALYKSAVGVGRNEAHLPMQRVSIHLTMMKSWYQRTVPTYLRAKQDPPMGGQVEAMQGLVNVP